MSITGAARRLAHHLDGARRRRGPQAQGGRAHQACLVSPHPNFGFVWVRRSLDLHACAACALAPPRSPLPPLAPPWPLPDPLQPLKTLTTRVQPLTTPNAPSRSLPPPLQAQGPRLPRARAGHRRGEGRGAARRRSEGGGGGAREGARRGEGQVREGSARQDEGALTYFPPVPSLQRPRSPSGLTSHAPAHSPMPAAKLLLLPLPARPSGPHCTRFGPKYSPHYRTPGHSLQRPQSPHYRAPSPPFTLP